MIWINRGLEVLWLLTIVLVPLAFVTRDGLISATAIAYLEVPKIALFRTLVALMAVLWLIEWGVQGQFHLASPFHNGSFQARSRRWLVSLGGLIGRQPTRWLTLAVVIYLAATILGTVLSTSFSVSMWGEVPGEDGYSAYTIVSYVLLFAVITTHLRSRPQVWRLLSAVTIMGVLVSGYSMFQHYGHDFLDLRFPINVTGSTSTMGNPILAGAVILMTIPITLLTATLSLQGQMKNAGFWWRLVLWVVVLTVQLLGLKFTDSRGPWFATGLTLLTLLGLVSVFLDWRNLTRVALVLGLAVVLALAIFYLPPRLESNESVETEPTISNSSNSAAEPTVTEAGSGITIDPGTPVQLATVTNRYASGGVSGRVDIWKASWRLMTDRPWFGFDSPGVSFLRPVIGYGPELFRYAYLLESLPAGENMIPSGALHAHNYFIHQGVELGFLGLLSSLGIFGTVFLVGGYQLLMGRLSYNVAHRLVLIALLATLAGRALEQMVGLARVSDLTLFWVLLALFAALPAIMRPSEEIAESSSGASDSPPGPGSLVSRISGSFGMQDVLRLTLVVALIGGIGTLTWFKTVNYPRAAVAAASSAIQAEKGELQNALSSITQAIDLAPDVWIHHNRRAAMYSAYRSNDLVTQESECSTRADASTYQSCLAKQVYLDHLAASQQRPLNFRARQALASAALTLATMTGDQSLSEEAADHFRDLTNLVPAAWPLYNQLAAAYLESGHPEDALLPLDRSMDITKEHPNSAEALLLRGVTYRDLGQPLKAVEDFTEAIRLRPDNPQPYNNRAMTYWILGQPERALADLDQIIGLWQTHYKFIPSRRSGWAEAYTNRAFIYRELGQPQRAIEDLDVAINLDPQYPVAYNNRGLTYFDQDEYLLAIEEYNEAIRLNHRYVQAYVNRGVARSEVGQAEQAVLDAEEALSLNPSHPGAYALRAIGYTLLGRDIEASQDTDSAVELGIERSILEAEIQELRDRR